MGQEDQGCNIKKLYCGDLGSTVLHSLVREGPRVTDSCLLFLAAHIGFNQLVKFDLLGVVLSHRSLVCGWKWSYRRQQPNTMLIGVG